MHEARLTEAFDTANPVFLHALNLLTRSFAVAGHTFMDANAMACNTSWAMLENQASSLHARRFPRALRPRAARHGICRMGEGDRVDMNIVHLHVWRAFDAAIYCRVEQFEARSITCARESQALPRGQMPRGDEEQFWA